MTYVNHNFRFETRFISLCDITVPDTALAVLVTPDRSEGTYIVLNERPCTLGRTENNSIRLGQDAASSCHATITWDNERRRHLLSDQRSTNGTVLNGLWCASAQLSNGDLLKLPGLRGHYFTGDFVRSFPNRLIP